MNKVGKQYTYQNDIEWAQVKKILKKGELKYDDNKKSIELNIGYIEHKERFPSIGFNDMLLANFPTVLQYKITSTRKYNGKLYSSVIMSHDTLTRMWEYKDKVFNTANDVMNDMEETAVVPYTNKKDDNYELESETITEDKRIKK